MIQRSAARSLEDALARQAAVVLLGPRQVGKTTLALAVARNRPAVYLDLENPEDRAKLADPALYFTHHADKLVVLDEIHRLPDLFPILRGVIDRGRREGRRVGRFLLLGSASLDLLRSSGETLAGRVAFIELTPFTPLEVGGGLAEVDRLWLRGGFPDSWTAASDHDSYVLRRDFIRSYLERDVPLFSPRIPAETLRRLWTMLGHRQGAPLNISELSRSLSIGAQAAVRYIDLLVDLLLLRRLPPFQANIGKRLVKSPKLYVRDTGLVHALLGLPTMDDLFGHPVVGASWEGFVVESLLAELPWRAEAFYYRTQAGAEIDLLLLLGGEIWAVEIKRSLNGRVGKGFHIAREDVRPTRSFVVHSGEDRFPLGDGIEAISPSALARELAARAEA